MLQSFTEFKRTYFGDTKRFDCKLLEKDEGEVVVLFRLERKMQFLGMNLDRESISIGYFWEDRNYNVYHWIDSIGSTRMYYFNIAKDTRIGPDGVEWLDLIVDVACREPDFKPLVLD